MVDMHIANTLWRFLKWTISPSHARLSDPSLCHSVANDTTGPWPTADEHRCNWVFVDLIWFSVPTVDAAIYACTHSSRPKIKESRPPPPLPPAPSHSPSSYLDPSNPQRGSPHFSNRLNHEARKPAASELITAHDIIKTFHQVNGTFFSLCKIRERHLPNCSGGWLQHLWWASSAKL